MKPTSSFDARTKRSASKPLTDRDIERFEASLPYMANNRQEVAAYRAGRPVPPIWLRIRELRDEAAIQES